ncbi:aldo/keto reductase [Salinispira pacifica]|uniref:Oxidoreductase, aldo/keto reductase family n=1 Tax=Salinispira pacifica TaxID=1307761 RepID=V5WFY1_9SPIO|nr:aldo/keto reductase [Salinispira pacifica]AHC14703.1 Oxidoreductase, aldo/keto reductase family [Salinispira pacifica]
MKQLNQADISALRRDNRLSEAIGGQNLIYGCMNLASSWDDTPLTDEQAARGFSTIEKALELGFTTFDHADIYCRGKSEELFGRFLAQQADRFRESIIIQSKAGIRFPDDGGEGTPGRYDFSPEHIRSSVEGILERLNCGYLDLFLLHRPDPLADIPALGRELRKLQNEGLIHYVGVSNHSASQIQALKKLGEIEITVNQMEISLGHRNLIEAGVLINQNHGDRALRSQGTLEYCMSEDIQLQAWSPLFRGRYSGGAADLSESEQRLRDYVSALAAEKDSSPEAIVLSWLMRHPAGIVPVIGSTHSGRMAACAGADGSLLSREEWYQLFVLSREEPLP